MDYDELAFKPELTWEELCEYVKEKARVSFWSGRLVFYKNGKIKDTYGNTLAENRTYEQMKTIIEALWG